MKTISKGMFFVGLMTASSLMAFTCFDLDNIPESVKECESSGSGCVDGWGEELLDYRTCVAGASWVDCENNMEPVGWSFGCAYNPNNQECYRVNIHWVYVAGDPTYSSFCP